MSDYRPESPEGELVSRRSQLVAQRLMRFVQQNGWVDRVLLAAIMVFFLKGWLPSISGAAAAAKVPASPRLEMLPPLSFVWRLRQQIVQGHLFPEWDPYEFGGYPWLRFLAFPIYLGVALATLVTGLSVETSMVGLYLIAYALSALAMYEWVYAVTRRRSAALVAGLVYGTFPYHMHMGVEWWEHALFWAVLPLPFALYEHGRRDVQKRAQYWVGMGAAAGLFPLINIDRTALSVVCLALYVGVRQLVALVRSRTGLWRDILLLAVAVAVATGLAACVILPAIEELPHVGLHLKRGAESLISDEIQAEYAISPRLLVVAAMRRLHLPVTTDGLPGIWRSFGGLNAWYVGLVALGLALAGILRYREGWVVPVVLMVLLLGFLVALGPRSPVNPVGFIPFLGTLRFQAHRGMMLVALAMGMLAGQGVAWVTPRLGRYEFRVGLSAILLILVALDHDPGGAVFQVRRTYFSADEVEAYSWLAGQGEGFRVWDYALSPSNQYLYTQGIVEGPVPRYWGYYDNGAPLHSFSLFNWGDDAAALDLSAVRYILYRPELAHHQLAMEETRKAGYHRVAWSSDHVAVLERPDWGPYARLYSRSVLYLGSDAQGGLELLPELSDRGIALVCGDSPYLEDYSLEELGRYDYLLLDEALERGDGARAQVEETLGDHILSEDVLLRTIAAENAESPARAAVGPRLVEGGTGPQEIEVWTVTHGAALLVVSESWYPNWQVAVDGEPGKLVRANYAFMGTWLPSGEHRVHLQYVRPRIVWIGAALSVATVMALVAAAALWGKRRR